VTVTAQCRSDNPTSHAALLDDTFLFFHLSCSAASTAAAVIDLMTLVMRLIYESVTDIDTDTFGKRISDTDYFYQ